MVCFYFDFILLLFYLLSFNVMDCFQFFLDFSVVFLGQYAFNVQCFGQLYCFKCVI